MDLRKQINNFFDALEVDIRSHLSRHSITYGIIGGIAIILFWRGVWLIADQLQLSGWASFFLGLAALLLTGLLTSSFIGDHIIISGLRREKKVVDLEEGQIKTERDILKEVKHKVQHIDEDVEKLEREVEDLKRKKQS